MAIVMASVSDVIDRDARNVVGTTMVVVDE